MPTVPTKPNTLKKIPTISFFQILKDTTRFVRNPIPILLDYKNKVGETFILNFSRRYRPMVTTNPYLAQYILQKNHRNFQKSPLQTNQLAHFIGNGLATSDGPYWLQQRRLIQPGFHRKKLAGLTDLMVREIDVFLDELVAEADGKTDIDIAHKMAELSFFIVGNSLFSTGLKKDQLNEVNQCFNKIQAFLARQIRQPFLKSWHRISGEQKKHETLAHRLQEIILQVIKHRKQSTGQFDDLLDMLLAARYEDTGEGMTEKQLLAESLIIFIAGHETSANALSWTWKLLCEHPEVMQKVQEEMDVLIGDRKPVFEDLRKLEYLTWVIQESMRLYPPVWILDRVPKEDDYFEGIYLPKGRIIGIHVYGIHHSQKFWSNPEKFDPTRFQKDATKKRPTYAYLPFGGGPRLCIGNNFAFIEMQLIILRMIQRFKLELASNKTIAMAPAITLNPKDGLLMTLKTRYPEGVF